MCSYSSINFLSLPISRSVWLMITLVNVEVRFFEFLSHVQTRVIIKMKSINYSKHPCWKYCNPDISMLPETAVDVSTTSDAISRSFDASTWIASGWCSFSLPFRCSPSSENKPSVKQKRKENKRSSLNKDELNWQNRREEKGRENLIKTMRGQETAVVICSHSIHLSRIDHIEWAKTMLFASFQMGIYCSKPRISIVGSGNVVNIKTPHDHNDHACGVIDQDFLTTVFVLTIIVATTILCIVCCYRRFCVRYKAKPTSFDSTF